MERYKKGTLKNKLNKKTFNYKKEVFSPSIVCLDVETSSGYLKNGNVYPFDRSKDAKYWDEYEKVNLLYEWSLGIDNYRCYGRNLYELHSALNEINDNNFRVIIFAHNLSYEFMYLLNVVPCDKLFARQAHKIIYFDSDNLQFRCSYFLTRLSLQAWGESVGVEKLVGNIDYEKIYTPNSYLTKAELDYCEHDILIMYEGLKVYVNRYGNVAKIPLTQTGEIRKVIKDMYKNDISYHKLMTRLLPRNASEYEFLRETFWGAYTHSNYFYTNKLYINVFGKDEASAYPFTIVSEKFPMSTWMDLDKNMDEYMRYNDNDHSLLVDVTLHDVSCDFFNTYISSHKCYYREGCVYDNGRILKAKKLSLKCTNIDLDIIKKVYKIKNDNIIFNRMLMAHNDYLDKQFVDYCLTLFALKTTLKGIPEKEDLMMQSKQFINSMYGMMVSKLIQSNVMFINNEWSIEELTNEIIDERLDDLRSKAYKNFLSYSHGVFVTAYARKNLWTPIIGFDNYDGIDSDVIYCDTDSIKYLNDHENIFDAYNNNAKKKLLVALAHHGIDPLKACPEDTKGIKHWLGVWENDKGTPYKEFKTLGAKRYCYLSCDDKLSITVSGVNKEKGVTAINKVDDFKDGLKFDYDASGKLIMSYLYDMPEVVWNAGQYDQYTSKQKYGIHAMPTTYNMTLTKDYKEILDNVIDKLI